MREGDFPYEGLKLPFKPTKPDMPYHEELNPKHMQVALNPKPLNSKPYTLS